jgi:hypothetical protein
MREMDWETAMNLVQVLDWERETARASDWERETALVRASDWEKEQKSD